MTATATGLLGLVTWAIVMTFVMLTARMSAILGGKPLNAFLPDGTDLSPVGHRITRGHANCLENLALLAVPLLYAIATNHTEVTDGLALLVLGSRVGQTITHIISTSKPAVLLRATLFSVQVVVALIWVWKFYQLA